MTNIIRVIQGGPPNASIVVKKADDITVRGISDVVSTDLQNGYTLVYNATTNKWVTQYVDSTGISSIDGGTY